MARLDKFLSTSSARRTTFGCTGQSAHSTISIHVLREEDDLAELSAPAHTNHFYPRPPRGGRQALVLGKLLELDISIHVLREEDDRQYGAAGSRFQTFLSTSSARRTTSRLRQATFRISFLSTSSARRTTFFPVLRTQWLEISIHVLREEDDTEALSYVEVLYNFYPRPPRGGRPKRCARWALS